MSSSGEWLAGSFIIYLWNDRENRKFRLFVDGHNYKTAAAELGVSVHTVSFHLRSIYEKLQVHSKSEAWPKRCATVSFSRANSLRPKSTGERSARPARALRSAVSSRGVPRKSIWNQEIVQEEQE